MTDAIIIKSYCVSFVCSNERAIYKRQQQHFQDHLSLHFVCACLGAIAVCFHFHSVLYFDLCCTQKYSTKIDLSHNFHNFSI